MLNIFGVQFHLYGLIIGVAILVALEYCRKEWVRRKLPNKLFERVSEAALVGGIIGARAYHVVDYWQYYSSDLVRILFLWEGGLGIWGALIGGLFGIACVVIYHKKQNLLLDIVDVVASIMPISQAIGRLGNWVNGEIVGRNGEPLFAYEAGLNIMLFFGMTKIHTHEPGVKTGVYLLGYGLIRILLEPLRQSQMIWTVLDFPVASALGVVSGIVGLALIIRRQS